ncbi:MAG: DUF6263 family protein [Chitinophagaceae bacterium]|nr:DUF6263 family protein [Chitinophagaceae bacterium]
MKKISIALLVISIAFIQQSNAQKYNSRIQMDAGAIYEVTTEVKNLLAQQANGFSFDFNLNGNAVSLYNVTNTGDENISLRHKLKRIDFEFDGMGSKMKFDSDNSKDLEREFGRPMRDMLAKSYDMIIDTLGKTLLVLAPTAAPSAGDDQYKLISGLLGDLGNVATPPQKGDPTIFMSWPGGELAVGESWSIIKDSPNDNYRTSYTLSSVNDSTFVIDFTGTGAKKIENEMRGMQVTVNMKTVTTGQMQVDRATGIVREKTTTVESSGTSEMMGGSTPINGKMTTITRIKKKEAQ